MRDFVAAAVAGGLFLALAGAASASRPLQDYLERTHVAFTAYPSANARQG